MALPHESRRGETLCDSLPKPSDSPVQLAAACSALGAPLASKALQEPQHTAKRSCLGSFGHGRLIGRRRPVTVKHHQRVLTLPRGPYVYKLACDIENPTSSQVPDGVVDRESLLCRMKMRPIRCSSRIIHILDWSGLPCELVLAKQFTRPLHLPPPPS